eukprot:6066257-Prymnesium_polylepis.1
MRWRWKRRKVLARRPPAEPEFCRAACTPAVSRRVREAVRWYEAAVRLVDDGPHLHRPLQRA